MKILKIIKSWFVKPKELTRSEEIVEKAETYTIEEAMEYLVDKIWSLIEEVKIDSYSIWYEKPEYPDLIYAEFGSFELYVLYTKLFGRYPIYPNTFDAFEDLKKHHEEEAQIIINTEEIFNLFEKLVEIARTADGMYPHYMHGIRGYHRMY